MDTRTDLKAADTQANTELVTRYVSEIFTIDALTMGGRQQGYFARYQGLLKRDSEQAHIWLFEKLQPLQLTPIFRWDGKRQEILIVHSMAKPKDGKLWVNILLFGLTFLSVLYAGASFVAEADPFASSITIGGILKFLWQGWPFAVSFLAILGTHEFGHYLMGRHHKVNVSLPYFIPFPMSLVGTMGAFINMKEIPRNRKQLFDIAIAGPLAGLLVAIPVLFIGLSLSSLDAIPASIPEGMGYQLEGNSIFYLLAKFIVFGKWLPQPADFGGLSPLAYWLGFFFTGRPLPLGGIDVIIHPVAWAGWVGLLITMLNLIPAGQFDGGHVFQVFAGRKVAQIIQPLIIVILVVLGFAWNGWWLWAALIFLMGRRYAEPLDQITTIDKKRKMLAILVCIIFVLIFIPVPLMIVTG
jgi:membrane-associated protease RseP (regulator of RpoE activity)